MYPIAAANTVISRNVSVPMENTVIPADLLTSLHSSRGPAAFFLSQSRP